jgi:type III secretion protein R
MRYLVRLLWLYGLWLSPLRGAWAQTIGNAVGDESITNRPLVLITVLAFLTLVPFVLMMITSFVKLAVVLSIVRQAIGTQQIPPTQVITGLATILTIYIMMPVGLDIYHEIQNQMQTPRFRGLNLNTYKAAQVVELGQMVQEPLRDFLIKHTHIKERNMFYRLAWRLRKPRDRASLTDRDFTVVTPAFVLSELKESFQIGFILFVPFLVVDMVVANVLMALGMQMLSPTTISLPFKILLFVLVDGWYLITRGLVLSYA